MLFLLSLFVDVSYLVSDLKYSQEYGLKICEVQHGSLSSLQGDIYLTGGDGSIAPKLADFFDSFLLPKYAAGLIYPPLKNALTAKGWSIEPSIKTLLKNSHPSIIYADFEIARNFQFYRHTYPSILFINAVTFPYWRDKYKMNALFSLNDELVPYKAEWRLYPKKYHPALAEEIQQEMPSDLYVIKPRSEVLAAGIIIVSRQELDHVLQTLEKHPYWSKNRDDSFLIEKYYPSDPLPLNESLYDATMRLAFILQSNNGEMTYHLLGGFWKLPSSPLHSSATLNEKHISCCKPPFYAPIDPTLLHEVNAHLENAMLLLYDQMLDNH